MKNIFETLNQMKEVALEVRNTTKWMKKHKRNYELLITMDEEDKNKFVLGVIDDVRNDYEESKNKREKAIEELIELILG